MTKSFKLSAAIKLALVTGMMSTLTACGGGDDAPTPAAAITITGNAATGVAIANATVSAVCKTGTGTAVTGADGAFTLKVAVPGEGPCILSLTQNGVTLRSVAAGDGARANITPLTEMLVNYAAVSSGAGVNATPQQLASNDGVRIIVTNASMLQATVNRLVQVLAGIDGSIIVPTDFLSATLVPKSATNPGNAQDVVLEALKAHNLITATGAPAPAVVTAVRADAGQNVLTGGTGGSGN